MQNVMQQIALCYTLVTQITLKGWYGCKRAGFSSVLPRVVNIRSALSPDISALSGELSLLLDSRNAVALSQIQICSKLLQLEVKSITSLGIGSRLGLLFFLPSKDYIGD